MAACVQSVGIKNGGGLSLDVPTWLNLTYDMLAIAMKFRKTFASLKKCEKSYKSLLSDDDWIVERIYDFLKPFNTITNLGSCTFRAFSSCTFRATWSFTSRTFWFCTSSPKSHSRTCHHRFPRPSPNYELLQHVHVNFLELVVLNC